MLPLIPSRLLLKSPIRNQAGKAATLEKICDRSQEMRSLRNPRIQEGPNEMALEFEEEIAGLFLFLGSWIPKRECTP